MCRDVCELRDAQNTAGAYKMMRYKINKFQISKVQCKSIHVNYILNYNFTDFHCFHDFFHQLNKHNLFKTINIYLKQYKNKKS